MHWTLIAYDIGVPSRKEKRDMQKRKMRCSVSGCRRNQTSVCEGTYCHTHHKERHTVKRVENHGYSYRVCE